MAPFRNFKYYHYLKPDPGRLVMLPSEYKTPQVNIAGKPDNANNAPQILKDRNNYLPQITPTAN